MKRATLWLLLLPIFNASFAQSGNPAPASIANNGKIWASIYQQRAAEYKALCFQAYNIAKLRLDMALTKHHSKPYAVITDIDETLLDNSPVAVKQALKNEGFNTTSWKEWTAKGIADTVPGAPAFFKYAASKGVIVFYVTNRDEDERTATLKNLKRYNLPFADDVHLKLKSLNATSGTKQPRRDDIMKIYNVVLLCGDNLPDFNMLYDGNFDEKSRAAVTQKLRKDFGNKYIVIPNADYGDWENAIFDGKRLTNEDQDKIIQAKVKSDQ